MIMKERTLFSYFSTNQPSGIDDITLQEIGESIITKLDKLAGQLGVPRADLKRYKETNHKTPQVTCDGTVQMLFDWREGVLSSEQRKKMGEALRNAGLIRIQENFLPDTGTCTNNNIEKRHHHSVLPFV